MILDIVVLVVLASCLWFGFRGGIRMGAAILVAVICGLLVWFLAVPTLPILPIPSTARWLVGPLSGAAVATLVLGALAVVLRHKSDARPGWGSRIAGGLLGAMAAAALVVPTFAVAGLTRQEAIGAVASARSYPALSAAAAGLADHAPSSSGLASLNLPPPAIAEPEQVAADEPSPRPIAWMEIGRTHPDIVRRYTGTVTASVRVPLSFEVGGQLASVDVAAGERVDPGQQIATLDDTQLRLDVETRAAALAEAEAVLEEARLNLDRRQALVARGVEAQATLDSAQATFGTARARVDVARSALARARDMLENGTVHAPYAGTIAARYVDAPAVVRAGEAIVDLERADGPLEIEVDVPEDVRNLIEIGQVHVLEHAGDDGTYPARVIEIGGRRAGGATYPINLGLETATPDLRSGATRVVRFTFSDDGRDGIAVPIGSIGAGTGDAAHVFAYDDATGSVRAEPVRMLDYTDGMAWIETDLPPGTIVATRGVTFLVDGQRVALMGEGVARFER